jgi:hypothetical protein
MDEVAASGGQVAAHEQRLTIRLVENIPAHGPRGPEFEAAKRRMKELGLVKCVIANCDTGAPVEYHHSIVEHAWQGGIDVQRLDDIYGLKLTEEEFITWVESPGNLEPLCSVHHRTQLGIHVMPEPLWQAIRLWKSGLKPPAELVHDAADAH